MISDYEKVEFLIEHNYFEHHKVSDIIKDIKFQCIIYLVEDWNLNLEEISFNEYLQSWIDYKFQDSDFIDFLKEQCFEDKINEEYQTIYKKIASFLNQKIAKPKDTPATYFFIKTSKIRFEHTAYKLIKQSISKLTNINYESLEAISIDEFKILMNHKQCIVPNLFTKFKLKNHLKIYNETDQVMGLYDFENYLKLPSIINENILKNNELEKTLCIEGLSGSGKTTLAQRIGYEVSKENSFYINLEQDLKGFNIEDKEDLIKEFLSSLSSSKGILILDNIHRNESTKYITRYLFQKSLSLNLKIILIAQHTMKTSNENIINFFENFFFDEKDKLKLNIIKLSNISSINKVQIKNFFQYYSNKNKFNSELTIAKLNDLEEQFGCHLSYLKYAFEASYDCNNIHIEDARLSILQKYSILVNLENNISEFKLLFCISNLNNSFSIPKAIYRLLPIEELSFIDDFLKKHLIFKLDYKNHYELILPHKSIAKLIIDSIKQNENKQMIEILINCLDYLKNLNHSFFNTFINDFIQNNDLNDNDLLLLLKYINKNETKENSLLTYKYLLMYSNSSLNIEYFDNNKESLITISNITKKHDIEDISGFYPNFYVTTWIEFLTEKKYTNILDFSIKTIVEILSKDPKQNYFDLALEILFNLNNLQKYKDLEKSLKRIILLHKYKLSKYLTYELELDKYRVFCNKFYNDEFMINVLIDNLEDVIKIFSNSNPNEKYYNMTFTIYFIIDHCNINSQQKSKLINTLDNYFTFIIKDPIKTILNTSKYTELISFIIEINLYFKDKKTAQLLNQIFDILIKDNDFTESFGTTKLEYFIGYCAVDAPFNMKSLYLFYTNKEFENYKPHILKAINSQVLEVFELDLSDFETRIKKNPYTYLYLL